jgi:hypothetical protein
MWPAASESPRATCLCRLRDRTYELTRGSRSETANWNHLFRVIDSIWHKTWPSWRNDMPATLDCVHWTRWPLNHAPSCARCADA